MSTNDWRNPMHKEASHTGRSGRASALPRGRQYVFRSRRCRQRMAQRLGAGLRPVLVAGIERIEVGELEALLEDVSFSALVGHYRELAGRSAAERRGWLVELARQMLERLVAVGDLRAIALVLSEEGRGRDPAAKLTDAVDRALQRAVTPPSMGGLPERPAPGAAKPGGYGRDHPSREHPDGAATQAGPVDVEALAAAEAGRVAQRLRRGLAGLRTKLLAEAEQVGTATEAAPAVPGAADGRPAAMPTAADLGHQECGPHPGPLSPHGGRGSEDAAPGRGSLPVPQEWERNGVSNTPRPGTTVPPMEPAGDRAAAPVQRRYPPYLTPFQRAGPPGTVFMANTRFKLV